jgi:predicted GNAT family N-acyltransferase
VSQDIRIEQLGKHDRKSFSCGIDVLDRYLREQASQDVKRLVSSCFIAFNKEKNTIVDYYTLAAISILANDLSQDVLKKLPRYPILPAALIGRLAIDKKYHRSGLGGVSLADTALRVLESEVKAFALVVEAKDENAKAFYYNQGFLSFFSREFSMFLPLETFKKALKPLC